jgi:hypothetical protein
MALRRVSRSATVLISAAVVMCASLAAAMAAKAPQGQVLSNFENHYRANIVRDWRRVVASASTPRRSRRSRNMPERMYVRPAHPGRLSGQWRRLAAQL